jgi:hypothetical protein
VAIPGSQILFVNLHYRFLLERAVAMKNALVLTALAFICVSLAFGASSLIGQEITQEANYSAYVPAGWTKTTNIPQGFDEGLQKQVGAGKQATIFLHYVIMPLDAGAPPADSTGMSRQWDAMIHNQFPDAISLSTPPPQVHGRMLINATYKLSDNGSLVERRYSYFFVEHTAFVVQCTAPPEAWASVQHDFDAFTFSLAPSREQSAKPRTSDTELLTNLRNRTPALVASWPSEWRCSVTQIDIVNRNQSAGRSLQIALSFHREDVGDIYRATKAAFLSMKRGENEGPSHALPPGRQNDVETSAEFVNFVGQVWGYAYGEAFGNALPIDEFRVIIEDTGGQRIGSVSISKTDAAAILSGKLTPEDSARISTLYVFE